MCHSYQQLELELEPQKYLVAKPPKPESSPSLSQVVLTLWRVDSEGSVSPRSKML